jgi:glycine oxidase
VELLKKESGVDPEFLSSGSMGLVFDEKEETAYREMQKKTDPRGFNSEWLTPSQARKIEPAITDQIRSVWHVPPTRQVRPPRLNQALLKTVQKRGITLRENEEVKEFIREGTRIQGVETANGEYEADQVLLAGGAWTGGLSQKLGVTVPVRPVRGQVVLFQATPGLFKNVLFSPSAYLVPRLDGHVYVGSTLEEAGFNKSVTEEAIHRLTQGARQAVPALKEARVEATWAGLRPAPLDGWPYLGPVPNFENLWVAAGHFTHGILLSAATGHLMSQALTGEKTEIPLEPFRVDRKPYPSSGIY